MRKMLQQKKSGFTLIELMIVVAILGILAAIAIPAFVTYVRRSKTAEATDQLKKMFDAATAYYDKQHAEQGTQGLVREHCLVDSATDAKADPSDQKQTGTYTGNAFDRNDPAHGIGFNVEFGYYSYRLVSPGTTCSFNSGEDTVYTMRAVGDLDDDAIESTFELAVGTNDDNELYHARGFYILNETE